MQTYTPIKHQAGAAVRFQYRQPHCLGGQLVRGTGTVIAETIVGVSDAYVIKPADGSDCVHVRAATVWAV